MIFALIAVAVAVIGGLVYLYKKGYLIQDFEEEDI